MTARSGSDHADASQNEATADSDRTIAEAPGAIATGQGISQAQIALAWLRRNPVVAAPLAGALKATHIDDAVAALSITLTDDEAARLTAPYGPRVEGQRVSDPVVLHRTMEAATGFKAPTLT